ncbi:MAG: hypothetical protein WCO60_11575 [Verrucomicrobiota bacterium]
MHNAKTYTTGSKADASLVKPEWIRVPEAIRVSGLKRSSLYKLLLENRIKSFSNKERGARRGVRLISHDGLIAYMEARYQESLEDNLQPISSRRHTPSDDQTAPQGAITPHRPVRRSRLSGRYAQAAL